MIFAKPYMQTAVRLLVLLIAMPLLAIPAAVLRPMFYPEGMSGNAVFLILFAVLIVASFILNTWVTKPLREEEDELLEKLNRLTEDSND